MSTPEAPKSAAEEQTTGNKDRWLVYYGRDETSPNGGFRGRILLTGPKSLLTTYLLHRGSREQPDGSVVACTFLVLHLTPPESFQIHSCSIRGAEVVVLEGEHTQSWIQEREMSRKASGDFLLAKRKAMDDDYLAGNNETWQPVVTPNRSDVFLVHVNALDWGRELHALTPPKQRSEHLEYYPTELYCPHKRPGSNQQQQQLESAVLATEHISEKRDQEPPAAAAAASPPPPSFNFEGTPAQFKASFVKFGREVMAMFGVVTEKVRLSDEKVDAMRAELTLLLKGQEATAAAKSCAAATPNAN